MLYYFDTSVVVKRYVKETGTTWVKQLFDPSLNNKIYFSQVTNIEVVAGLSKKVRTKELSRKYYQLALQLFLNDLDSGDYNIVPVNDDIVKLAINLTKEHPLRAYYALHLATAISLNSALALAKLPLLAFICADKTLLVATKNKGLIVDNPNLH